MPEGVTVHGPDGNTYQFPDGTSKEAAIAFFKKKGVGAPPDAAAQAHSEMQKTRMEGSFWGGLPLSKEEEAKSKQE